MSSLEENEVSRVKNKNVIQYASDQMNGIGSKSTMEGIKEIVAIDKTVKNAILIKIAEKNNIVNEKTYIPTGKDIEEALKGDLYREMVDR